jgi:hypothetical protein
VDVVVVSHVIEGYDSKRFISPTPSLKHPYCWCRCLLYALGSQPLVISGLICQLKRTAQPLESNFAMTGRGASGSFFGLFPRGSEACVF